MSTEYKEILSKLSWDKKDELMEILVTMLNKYDPHMTVKLMDDIMGLDKFNNYLSEIEYKAHVAKLVNQDNSTGPKFHNTLIETTLVKANLPCNEEPKYNKWALFYTINYMASVYCKFTAEIANKLGVSQVTVCYNLAIAKLSDLNCPKWIREKLKL